MCWFEDGRVFSILKQCMFVERALVYNMHEVLSDICMEWYNQIEHTSATATVTVTKTTATTMSDWSPFNTAACCSVERRACCVVRASYSTISRYAF